MTSLLKPLAYLALCALVLIGLLLRKVRERPHVERCRHCDRAMTIPAKAPMYCAHCDEESGAKLDNSVWWLADDGTVRRLDDDFKPNDRLEQRHFYDVEVM